MAFAAPSVRRAVGWITPDPKTIDPTDHQWLDSILAASPPLSTLARHIRVFAIMMRSLRGQDLEAWTAAADTKDESALGSFLVGLHRDQDAVTAGLPLPGPR